MNDSHDTRNMATEGKLYHILILEDDDAHIELIRRGFQLAAPTYTLTFAQSVKDARAALIKNPPDLIIADWLLPDGKGIDILPRKDGQITTPLVIMTSHGNEKLAVDMLKSGAIDYIVKSEFTFKYLPHIAERALREWQNITERERAEDAFHTLAVDHSTIINNAPAMIWEKDTKNTFIRVNPAAAKAFGKSIEEIEGKSASDLFPEMAEKYYQDDIEVIKTGIPKIGIVEQMPTATSEVLWVQTDKVPLKNEQGEVTGVLVFVVDITEHKRAESALRESEERFRGLVDTITSGVAIYKVQGDGASGKDYIITDFNRMALELESKMKDQVIGKSLADLRPTINKYGLIPVFQRVWKTGVPEYYPQKIYVDEKYANWYENRVFRLQSGEIVAVYNDVTDQKRAEEALRESEVLFRTMIDWTYDWEYWIDTNQKLIYITPSIERITGYTAEEFMADSNLIDRIVHPDDRELWDTHIKFRIASNDADPANIEFRIIHRDGSQRWIGHICRLIKSKDGTNIGIRVSNRDITDRKQAESALRQSEQFLDKVVEQIPDMIFVKDAEDLRFVRFNKAGENLLGYSREELRGKNDYDLFPKDQADFFIGKDRDVLRMNQLTDVPEERIQTRNMGERLLHTKKIPLVDEDGNPKYLLGISEDITERKQAEERINLANRKLALMTDVTFQDIQNKVTALRGYIEIGKENVRENEPISLFEKEEDILGSIHRLIRNTKEYQQMGVNQLRWISLEPTIRMQASLISGRPDIPLDIDLSGLEIYSDPLIDRVFYNLIDNAVKHGGNVTRISFTCHETPDGLIVSCEDDGVGIPLKQKAHIFDRIVGGEGKFGLFFVREFLDMSGMTITETGEPGKGARFEITVPKGMYRFTGA